MYSARKVKNGWLIVVDETLDVGFPLLDQETASLIARFLNIEAHNYN